MQLYPSNTLSKLSAALVVLLGLVLAACSPAGSDGSAGKSGVKSGAGATKSASKGGGRGGFSRGPTLVVAEPAALRLIREEVEAIGTTLANESITVTAQVTDTISAVQFDDGDFVAKGDVLVELTSEEEAALLAESKANLDDAQRQADRLENLLRQQSVPESQVG